MRLLFLDIDTLRPDHLGCYGYHRNTSPNIDRIASEGVRFDNYYCSDAPCLPSRAALVSGQFGIRNGIVGHGGTAADMRLDGEARGFHNAFSDNCLWTMFVKSGFHTATISPFAQRHSAWWFNAGFNETCDTGKGGMESAEEITPHALAWLDRNGASDNWLLHVNLWDPHTPYRAPEAFGNPFKDDPLPSWLDEKTIKSHNKQPGGHSSLDLSMFSDIEHPAHPRQPGKVTDLAGFRRMIDGYDCGVRYADKHVGMLLDKLAALGILEDTAIIVTSDHGENLGELNSYAEHGTADNITHRIPMIVKMPGCAKGHVDGGLHYNLDFAPTLAELGILKSRPSSWQGESYAKALKGKPSGRPHLVLGQCAHGAMRSVRFGDWIYIRVIHDFYHLYPREMLFNLKDDPHETRDLAGERPEICAEAARTLLTWQEDMMMAMPDAIDPLWTVMREGGPFHSRGGLKSYCEHLKATGRKDCAGRLVKIHPSEMNARCLS